MKKTILTLAIVAASLTVATLASAAVLNRSQLIRTFSEEFDCPVNYSSTGWKTWFYWGEPSTNWTGRVESGVSNIFCDLAYNGINPFSQGKDLFTITAAPCANPTDPKNRNLPYTSGVITTQRSFSQLYGYFEMKAALPIGRGLWPAFWMLSASLGAKEEIDVMEALGHDLSHVYSAYHYRVTNQSKLVTVPIVDTSKMHTYGLLWTQQSLQFYLDDLATATYPNPGYHDPMYLIACLQVGAAGSWPGLPDLTTKFPAKMVIEHIRAYKIKN